MKRAQAEGVDALFRVVGHVADMPAAYAASDVVVVPCIAPPIYGQVVAEAQAMARPVIASAIGPIPENMVMPPRMPDELRTGWVVQPGDSIEIARALATALALDATDISGAGGARAAIRRIHVRAGPRRRRDAGGLHLAAGSRAVARPTSARASGCAGSAKRTITAACMNSRPAERPDRRADAARRRGRCRRRRAGPHSRRGRTQADRGVERRPPGRRGRCGRRRERARSTWTARIPRSCCATRSPWCGWCGSAAATWCMPTAAPRRGALCLRQDHRRAVPDHLAQGLPPAERVQAALQQRDGARRAA